MSSKRFNNPEVMAVDMVKDIPVDTDIDNSFIVDKGKLSYKSDFGEFSVVVPDDKVDIEVFDEFGKLHIYQVLFSVQFIAIDKRMVMYLLSNNRFYMTKSSIKTLSYKDEIDLTNIALLHTKVKSLEESVAMILTKVTNITKSFIAVTSSNKTIDTVLPYEESLNTTGFSDLAIAYCIEANSFYYYSVTLKEWLALPDHWQNLDVIVRNKSDISMDSSDLLVGELSTSLVYLGNSIQLPPINKIGDVFIVKSGGLLVKNDKDWTYIKN